MRKKEKIANYFLRITRLEHLPLANDGLEIISRKE
jgi:hypothetical protein